MLNQRLFEYLDDVENPETNYNLAVEYKKIGQTAASISFFLRCADRCGENLDLAYECLIHIGECFDIQGNRDTHAFGAYKQALSILPRRPEAYYAMCRMRNWQSSYEDGYHYSQIALSVCEFDSNKPLRNWNNYRGKFCLIFEKALSSWWWGKYEMCRNTFLDLCENHWDEMNQYEKNTTTKYLKEHYNIDVNQVIKQKQMPVIGVPIVNGTKNMKINKDISVIFYGIKNSDPSLVRSNCFILKDILKEYNFSALDYVDQNQIDKPNKLYDVFVYYCRNVDVTGCHFGKPLSFTEVKDAVIKYKPKIIIQLGDEWVEENNDEHNLLGNYCKLFLRQHRHQKQAKNYTKNTIQIPVGYANEYLSGSTDIKKIKDRELSWSWVGQMTTNASWYKVDRDEMIREFWKIWNNTTICDSFDKFYGSKLYKLYSNSIFVPCGRGNWSLECFRNFEAIVAGAIPVVAGSEEEIRETFTFQELPPWIYANTWKEAVQKCMSLNKEELQIMQDNNLAWYDRIMNHIRNRIDESLSDSIELNNNVGENTNLKKEHSKNQIPVIGVPIVNGTHWLRRMVDSIDYPVKNLLIINNNGRNQIDQELNQIRDIGHPLVENIHICHMPSNIGVSMAWNLIIKSYIMEPYWIISSHDVAFAPGLLEKMYYNAENSDYEMIHAKQSPDHGYGGCYDLFLIKDAVVQKCGLFDENLSPAYCEDIDYMFRVDSENIKRVYLDIDYLHGEKDYATSGAQTWRTDLSLKEKIFFSGSTNDSYIYEKWGFQPGDYNRAYEKPFNNQSFDNKQTRFDLEFIRKKNLGF